MALDCLVRFFFFFPSLLVNLCFKFSWLGFCFVNINSPQSNSGFVLAQYVTVKAMLDSIYGQRFVWEEEVEHILNVRKSLSLQVCQTWSLFGSLHTELGTA